MILYCYKCNSCGKEFDELNTIEGRNLQKCLDCEGDAKIIINGSKPYFFPEGMWEDLDINPIHISSKKQLREECKRRGVYAKYLD